MLLQNLIEKLDMYTKVDSAYEWDNSGLITGDLKSDISTVLLTLEVADEVIYESLRKNAQLIVSHHPVIFSGIKQIITGEDYKNPLYTAISHNIALYASHTNFDMLDGGINDCFLDILGVEKIGYVYEKEKPIGRIFEFPDKLDINSVYELLCDKFKFSNMNLIACDKTRLVKKVAVVTGSGFSIIKSSINSDEVDLIITGDIKYHDAQFLISHGYCVIDMGHYGTEQIFPQAFYNFAVDKISEIKWLISETDVNPFVYLNRGTT